MRAVASDDDSLFNDKGVDGKGVEDNGDKGKGRVQDAGEQAQRTKADDDDRLGVTC